MKSMRLQKFQFSNSLVNWKNLDLKTRLILREKKNFFHLFLELGKIEKSRKSNIQKFKNLCVNWEKRRSTA